jgi:hypothetical protein
MWGLFTQLAALRGDKDSIGAEQVGRHTSGARPPAKHMRAHAQLAYSDARAHAFTQRTAALRTARRILRRRPSPTVTRARGYRRRSPQGSRLCVRVRAVRVRALCVHAS